jgi:hypothetical protein
MKVLLDKYAPSIRRVDIHGTRFYTKDGKCPLPSVTSLLDTPEKQAGLERWRKYTPDWRWITNKALERGTIVHEAIEYRLIKGELPEMDRYENLMYPLLEQMEHLVDTVHAVECMLHSEQIGAAGTADLVCTLKDGRTVIGDYKTSETMKDTKYMKDYFIQTLTYSKMYELEIGRKIDGCMILNVYEKPKPSCRPIIVDITEKALNKTLSFIRKQSDEILEKSS